MQWVKRSIYILIAAIGIIASFGLSGRPLLFNRLYLCSWLLKLVCFFRSDLLGKALMVISEDWSFVWSLFLEGWHPGNLDPNSLVYNIGSDWGTNISKMFGFDYQMQDPVLRHGKGSLGSYMMSCPWFCILDRELNSTQFKSVAKSERKYRACLREWEQAHWARGWGEPGLLFCSSF